ARLRRFVDRGSSLGGARPKAATDWQSRPALAKFARSDDSWNVVRAEYAAMTLAARCGLAVSAVDLVTLVGHDVLIVDRFDRQTKDGRIRRVPFASAATMLRVADPASRRFGYGDLADVLRRTYGPSDPAADLRELFRRMVFNVLIKNS